MTGNHVSANCELQRQFMRLFSPWRPIDLPTFEPVVMACRYVRADGAIGWHVEAGDKDLLGDLEPVFVALSRTETETHRLYYMSNADWSRLSDLISASSLTATEGAMRAALKWNITPKWRRREILTGRKEI